jgi:hypothetical protein
MANGSGQPQGSLWPIYVLFVVSLCVAVTALFSPDSFGTAATHNAILTWAAIVAFLTVLLIVLPRILIWLRMADAIQLATQIADIRTQVGVIADSLHDSNNGGNRLAGITSNLDLPTRLDEIERRLVALGGVQATLNQILVLFGQGGYARLRLDAIAAQFDDAGRTRQRLDAIVAQLGDGGETRQRLDAIAAQFNDGGYTRGKLDALAAQFASDGYARQTLDAINSRLKPGG